MNDAPKYTALTLTKGYQTNWYGVIADFADDDPHAVDYIRLDLHEAAVAAARAEGMREAAAIARAQGTVARKTNTPAAGSTRENGMNDIGIKRIVGPTILLASGNYFDFENPEGSQIDLHDIVNGLSHLCRFTGQCHTFYSVAEHSVHCSHLVPPEDAFAALMHDAAEAVLGDVSRPLKSLLPDYKRIEKRVEAAIAARFNLPVEMPASVKQADLHMLAVEQRQCMLNRDNWPGIEINGPIPEIKFWSPEEAYRQFCLRWGEVTQATRSPTL